MMHKHKTTRDEVFSSLELNRTLTNFGLDRQFLHEFAENKSMQEKSLAEWLRLTMEYTKNRDSLERQIQEDKGTSETLQNDIADFRNELKGLETALERKKVNLKEKEEMLEDKEERIRNYEDKLGHFSNIEKMEEKQKDLNQQILETNKDITRLSAEKQRAKEKLSYIENHIQERIAEAGKIEASVKTLMDLDKLIKDKEERLDSLNKEYSENEEKIKLGIDMFELITKGSPYEFSRIQDISESIVSSDKRYEYLEKELRERAIAALTFISKYGVVGLRYPEGKEYGIIFVDKEEYDRSVENFNYIYDIKLKVEEEQAKIGRDVSASIRVMMNTDPKPQWLTNLIQKSVDDIINSRLEGAEDILLGNKENVFASMQLLIKRGMDVHILKNNGSVSSAYISADLLVEALNLNRNIIVGDSVLPICDTLRLIIMQMAKGGEIAVRERPPIQIVRDKRQE